MGSAVSLSAGYFDKMYAAADDPWRFQARWYEQRKYALTAAMLPVQNYRDGFEPGCSIGVLTVMLAGRCDRLLSCDLARAAVRAARERTRGIPNVRVEHRELPAQWPSGSFDLIVFSEFLYYFGDGDLTKVTELGEAALRPGGTMLAVHWRHPVADYPQDGDTVHQVLRDRPGLAPLAGYRDPDFLAEVLIRTDSAPVSVAQATGLA
ncbi:MAG TPA: SAM-dependent methyltransferase [Streptosporangiaceae bacterium]|nr:SAM-dependent methyltransferase [Streptosporangiaceae bacterium]